MALILPTSRIYSGGSAVGALHTGYRKVWEPPGGLIKISLAASLVIVSALESHLLPPLPIPPKWILDMGLDDPEIISAGRELAKPELLSVRLDSR